MCLNREGGRREREDTQDRARQVHGVEGGAAQHVLRLHRAALLPRLDGAAPLREGLSCRRPRLLDDPGLRFLVQRKILKDRWAPEQVAGRVALESGGRAVSAATIYRAINGRRLDTPEMRGAARGMRGRLRHRGKKERRGRIPGAMPVSERPAEASSRSRDGGWEGDTVVGRGAGPCLVTLVDRADGFLAGGRSASHTGADVTAAAARAHAHPGPRLRVRRVPRGGGGDRSHRLLRRAAAPLGARDERDHQRAGQGVLPEGHRLLGRRRRGGGAGVRCHQPQASQAPRVANAVGGPPRAGVALAVRIQADMRKRRPTFLQER